MRERAVDLALLAGLVIVCVLIVFALFSPTSFNLFRSNPPQAVTTAETEESAPASAAETAPPVIASGVDGTVDAETGQETEPPAAPSADETLTDSETETEGTAADSETTVESETTVDSAAVEDEAAAETTEAETTETAAAPADAAPGSVQLERIGFSFVTGNAHACGVVLEAWEHVAVSRDLLERYPCGSQVTITFDEPVDGRSSVTAVVGDTMNPDTTNTVNIYVGQGEPAQQYGVQAGQLSAQ